MGSEKLVQTAWAWGLAPQGNWNYSEVMLHNAEAMDRLRVRGLVPNGPPRETLTAWFFWKLDTVTITITHYRKRTYIFQSIWERKSHSGSYYNTYYIRESRAQQKTVLILTRPDTNLLSALSMRIQAPLQCSTDFVYTKPQCRWFFVLLNVVFAEIFSERKLWENLIYIFGFILHWRRNKEENSSRSIT